MSKRTMKYALIMVLLSMMVACSGKHPSKLVGTWEKSAGDSSWGKRITLSSNGTGVYTMETMRQSIDLSAMPWDWMETYYVDVDTQFSWRVEKRRLYLIGGNLIPEYEYSISGNELMLKTTIMGTTSVATYRKQR